MQSKLSKFINVLITYLYLRISGVEVEWGDVRMYGFPLIIKAKGSRIIVRKGTTLVSSSRNNPAGINHCVILATMCNGATIEIDGAGLSGSSIVCAKGIYIGRNSGLGANSNIYDTDFHILDPSQRMVQKSIIEAEAAKVKLGKNVWVSSSVNILKGVNIGDNSVVGCGSVVTRDIESGYLYAGVPARKIRSLN